MDFPVAVVGAGLAGLIAARLLQAAGVDFLVVEARDRLGGRILTTDGAGAPCEDGFDLGPSWYWPLAQPAIAELMTELGLPAFDQYSEGDVVFERMSREPRHRYRSVDLSPQSRRMVGGSAALVRALARDVPAGKIMLDARVTRMMLDGETVRLNVARPGGLAHVLVARHVIAALPPRLLESTVVFTPGMEAPTVRRWRDTPTWMAPHAKFFALYTRPFWRGAGLSGTAQSMVGPMMEIHDATTASGQAALFGFLGVPAEHRAALGRQRLVAQCIEQFVRIFGDEARRPAATIFKDWAADPLTAAVADRTPVAFAPPSDAPWVSGDWQKRLAMAGSETSDSDAGYLSGAIAAAKRAVSETLARAGVSRV